MFSVHAAAAAYDGTKCIEPPILPVGKVKGAGGVEFPRTH